MRSDRIVLALGLACAIVALIALTGCGVVRDLPKYW